MIAFVIWGMMVAVSLFLWIIWPKRNHRSEDDYIDVEFKEITDRRIDILV